MKVKGIIFDMDGTLGDTMAVLCEAFRQAFEQFLGRRYSDQEIAALFGATEEGIFQRVVPDRWRDCLQVYSEIYEKIHARLDGPFPGIEEALRLLKQRGVSLGIVTGKGPPTTAISLRDFNLTGYFEVVETGSAAGAVKPHLIRKVVERWDIPSDRVAYIGDTPYDVEAAKEADVIPLAAAWAPATDAAALNRAGPLATFTTVESFIRWVDGNIEADGS
ncbi:MAG: HAD family hydrolase [Candidatus Tritonobacter lacicola]|nr:HAD family hydrolase [Candidatus Tritonobacter lacicola]